MKPKVAGELEAKSRKGPILDQIGAISSEIEPKSSFFVENVFVKKKVAGGFRPIAFLAELQPF